MINRRAFLILGGSGIAATGVIAAHWKRAENFILRYRRPRLDRASPTGRLSTEEMETILAAADVLIPAEEKPEYLQELVRSHVEHQTSHVKGYLREYKNATILLDETTRKVVSGGRRFSELEPFDRHEVLDSILWKYRAEETWKSRFEQILSPTRNLSFRRFVVRDILRALFQKSPKVTAEILGYPYYPGSPKDPRAYSRQPKFLRP